jgi:hypothetical protein
MKRSAQGRTSENLFLSELDEQSEETHLFSLKAFLKRLDSNLRRH